MMDATLIAIAALGVALCIQCMRLTRQRDRLRREAGRFEETRRDLVLMATSETLTFVTGGRWRDCRGTPLKLLHPVTFRLDGVRLTGLVDLANYPCSGRYDPAAPYVIRYVQDGQERTVSPENVLDLRLVSTDSLSEQESSHDIRPGY